MFEPVGLTELQLTMKPQTVSDTLKRTTTEPPNGFEHVIFVLVTGQEKLVACLGSVPTMHLK